MYVYVSPRPVAKIGTLRIVALVLNRVHVPLSKERA